MILLTIFTITVPILLVVAFTTLFERQVMATVTKIRSSIINNTIRTKSQEGFLK